MGQRPIFHDYPLLRIHETPRIETFVVASGTDTGQPWGPVGETGVPPLAPALVNAVFAATGQRVRSLPVEASHPRPPRLAHPSEMGSALRLDCAHRRGVKERLAQLGRAGVARDVVDDLPRSTEQELCARRVAALRLDLRKRCQDPPRVPPLPHRLSHDAGPSQRLERLVPPAEPPQRLGAPYRKPPRGGHRSA